MMKKSPRIAAPRLWQVIAKSYHAQSISNTGLGLTDFAALEALLHKGPLAINHRASPDASDAARGPGRSQWTERNRDLRLEAAKHLHKTLNLARRRGFAGF